MSASPNVALVILALGTAARACGNEDDDDASDGACMMRDDVITHGDGCE